MKRGDAMLLTLFLSFGEKKNYTIILLFGSTDFRSVFYFIFYFIGTHVLKRLIHIHGYGFWQNTTPAFRKLLCKSSVNFILFGKLKILKYNLEKWKYLKSRFYFVFLAFILNSNHLSFLSIVCQCTCFPCLWWQSLCPHCSCPGNDSKWMNVKEDKKKKRR